ncbi:MAG TPA: hypothetical protein VHT28_08340 [Silvibacterium sp.]|jgi:Mn-containing catalase|nr:hypothetical protein [Silvibacterium sp.]
MEKPPFSVGIIQPTPGLIDEFFNGSTGESQYGEADFHGPWNNRNGLRIVESEIIGGSGLDVTPIRPNPVRSRHRRSTPRLWESTQTASGRNSRTSNEKKAKEAKKTAQVEV